MALFVTQFRSLSRLPTFQGGPPAPTLQAPAIRTDVYTPGAGNAQSPAFDPACAFVRVHTDAAVKIAIDANPDATAATQGFRLAAGQTETFGVNPAHLIAYATTA
jgi:hypothetical protein